MQIAKALGYLAFNIKHSPLFMRRSRYFYHYLFWAIVLLSYFVDAAELRHFNMALFFRTLLLKNGLLIALVYWHLRGLLPLLDRKQYGRYAIGLLLTFCLGTWLVHRVETKAWRPLMGSMDSMHTQLHEERADKVVVEIEEMVTISPSKHQRLMLAALTVCRYLVISVLLKFIDDFFRQRELLQKVQHEKTMAELAALKAQINPHFLFNTLNTLYGLVLERSDLAAETVLKLADLMKYTLAEGNADQVPLEKDLENLRCYVDLEKLRLADAEGVVLDITGDLDRQWIAPLLLLPLVENAFKYGVHRSREKPLLRIAIHVDETQLTIQTTNRKPAQAWEGATSLGMGLQNVRKRLDLLYPGRYRFQTEEDDQLFLLTLQITLGNN